jgi:hypothetical protein
VVTIAHIAGLGVAIEIEIGIEIGIEIEIPPLIALPRVMAYRSR